jgi:hypothetical protein
MGRKRRAGEELLLGILPKKAVSPSLLFLHIFTLSR